MQKEYFGKQTDLSMMEIGTMTSVMGSASTHINLVPNTKEGGKVKILTI